MMSCGTVANRVGVCEVSGSANDLVNRSSPVASVIVDTLIETGIDMLA